MKNFYCFFEFLYLESTIGVYTFKCFVLRFQARVLIFKRSQLLLKRSKLLAQKDKPFLLDGGRAVLGDKFLDTVENAHEIVAPNVKLRGAPLLARPSRTPC